MDIDSPINSHLDTGGDPRPTYEHIIKGNMYMNDILIIEGTKGIGRELALSCAAAGESAIIGGRSLATAKAVAQEINAEAVRGIAAIRAGGTVTLTTHRLFTHLFRS